MPGSTGTPEKITEREAMSPRWSGRRPAPRHRRRTKRSRDCAARSRPRRPRPRAPPIRPVDQTGRQSRADGCRNVAPGTLHNGAPVWYRVIVSLGAPMPRRSSPADGGSSNGRTADSDSASLGSNPSPPATIQINDLGAQRGLFGGLFRVTSCTVPYQGNPQLVGLSQAVDPRHGTIGVRL